MRRACDADRLTERRGQVADTFSLDIGFLPGIAGSSAYPSKVYSSLLSVVLRGLAGRQRRLLFLPSVQFGTGH